jgi:hypothetical protein
MLLTVFSEIRGLSKKLIQEHEFMTTNFRNPWTSMPMVSVICPFLTDRERNLEEKIYTGMNLVNEALNHHQNCWRQPPRCDNNQSFHVTFYEIVDLVAETELESEIWRSGKLHSESKEQLKSMYGISSRRIRESACTVSCCAHLKFRP